jgi:hypothetical protein
MMHYPLRALAEAIALAKSPTMGFPVVFSPADAEEARAFLTFCRAWSQGFGYEPIAITSHHSQAVVAQQTVRSVSQSRDEQSCFG